MDIHFIRHGRTAASERGIYCGMTDLPLSDSGVTEILLLKQQDIYPPAQLFFTSRLLRAEQTLDLIYGTVPRKVVPSLVEYDFGIYEMKSYEELKEQRDYVSWITDETDLVSCPRGESRKQFAERVLEGYKSLLNEVRQAGVSSAAVVCHGGVIVRIMEHLFPKRGHFYEWLPPLGRGITLVVDAQSVYHRI